MPSVPSIRPGDNAQFFLRIFGFEIARRKALPTGPIGYDRGGWWPVVSEPRPGAWQRNMEESAESLLTQHAVYACITLIASDIATCRIRLVEQDENDIWNEVRNSAHSPVLAKPNSYQTRIQFFESWMVSKLTSGNTYVLKGRDNRQVVNALYVLDPRRTRPLVAPNGDVYYELSKDTLAGVEDQIRVPASEIIHDMTTLRYHDLCGVPPLAPASLAATQGLNIQRTSINLFQNGARPGAVLTAPGPMEQSEADRAHAEWYRKFGGNNVGMLAILQNGMTYQPVAHTAVEAQEAELIGLSAKMVCSAFQVPAHFVLGDPPKYDNIEAQNRIYYSQCLRKHFEAIELCLDEGLGLTEVDGKTLGVEFDLDDLFRMDTERQIKTYAEGVRGMILASNEARKKLGYGPVEGGDVPFGQHQQYPVDMLADRERPLPGDAATVPREPPPAHDNATEEEIDAAKTMYAWRASDLTANLAARIKAVRVAA